MTAALDRDRLAKVLGMLGSHHDGEVLTAGRTAHALLRAAGTTWPELLGANAAQLPVWREPQCKADLLDLIAEWEHLLTPWERRFVVSVSARPKLSAKQAAVIDGIVDKIRYTARSTT
jgi:hypothetical protein